jgi:hypothetical protein
MLYGVRVTMPHAHRMRFLLPLGIFAAFGSAYGQNEVQPVTICRTPIAPFAIGLIRLAEFPGLRSRPSRFLRTAVST